MTIYAIDDEKLLLDTLCEAVRAAVPGAELFSFTRPSALLAALTTGTPPPDVAFLDIEMPGMNGLELAQHIKTLAPRANVVFVTGYSQYALEALALRPSGYVMKPATRENILTELKNLREPPARTVASKRVRIQCFGAFAVFADGAPVPFARAKSKELLAYLVDRRGASCTAAKLASVLWEDEPYDRAHQKQLSVVRAELRKTLRQVGADILVCEARDAISVAPESFDCDYYMALAGDVTAINSFTGEYMSDYSWAEYTAATLETRYGAE